jgi:hypothetical protein
MPEGGTKMQLWRWWILGLIVLYVVSGYTGRPCAEGIGSEEYIPEEIPMLVISYSFVCSRPDEFKCLESVRDNSLTRLGRNIDALPGSISTGMGFVHMALTVTNDVGNASAQSMMGPGRWLQQMTIPDVSILFVTTPIAEYGNRVLVILSSVSPDSTTIISVDDRLNVSLLYNSFLKNELKNKDKILGSNTLGSVYSVRFVESGSLVLKERRRVRYDIDRLIPPREFLIDLRSGGFKLSMVE